MERFCFYYFYFSFSNWKCGYKRNGKYIPYYINPLRCRQHKYTEIQHTKKDLLRNTEWKSMGLIYFLVVLIFYIMGHNLRWNWTRITKILVVNFSELFIDVEGKNKRSRNTAKKKPLMLESFILRKKNGDKNNKIK